MKGNHKITFYHNQKEYRSGNDEPERDKQGCVASPYLQTAGQKGFLYHNDKSWSKHIYF